MNSEMSIKRIIMKERGHEYRNVARVRFRRKGILISLKYSGITDNNMIAHKFYFVAAATEKRNRPMESESVRRYAHICSTLSSFTVIVPHLHGGIKSFFVHFSLFFFTHFH